MKIFVATALTGAVLVAGMSLGSTGPANAMSVVGSVPAQTTNLETHVVKVQRFRKRRRGRKIRRGVALGIGAVILGGIIASQARPRYEEPPRVYHRPRHRSSWRARQNRCARNFRSYSYRTNTIIGYDGIERRCPYL